MSLGRIFLVDDEADVRKAVRLTLTKAGYDMVEAEDGEKAYKQLGPVIIRLWEWRLLPFSANSPLPCPSLC